jgi:choline kinase
MNIMRAVILAAGSGKRLRPLTDNLPKILLPLSGNYRILDLTFKALKENGIHDITIVVGYKYEMIVNYIARNYPFPEFSVSYIFNPIYDRTNTAYSLLLSCTILKKEGGIIINGDTLFSPSSLRKLLNFRGSCVGISHTNVDQEAVKVIYDDNNRILAIGKNIEGKAEYVGICKVEPLFGHLLCEQLNYCFKSKKDLFYSQYYDDIINQLTHRYPIYAVDLTEDVAMDIDTREDLDKAKLILENSKERFSL